ncbi:unnamed protein product, partial [marine sediment metagenome]
PNIQYLILLLSNSSDEIEGKRSNLEVSVKFRLNTHIQGHRELISRSGHKTTLYLDFNPPNIGFYLGNTHFKHEIFTYHLGH